MNVINIEHISKIYGEKTIFEDASFGLQQGDKVGIVGINGTGKSTLLRMVAGEEEPDEGQIVRQNQIRIAYLPQNPEFPMEETIAAYAFDGEAEAYLVQSNLNQLGIDAYDTKLCHLSGGQRRKVALAKVLALDFDVLILDEPTNHLDNEMLNWLEDYLRRYRGTVFMVTHDRYFLDRVSNRILEISHGKMYSYSANYSRFLELKAEREEMELASERKRQSVLRMELEWAKRGCRARSTKQKARLERLEALKNGTAPLQDQTVEMDAVETRMGKKTIELHHVTKGYEGTCLIRDFDYTVLRGQRLGIIGANGCGKTTLIRMIAGLEAPDQGQIEIGETIRIGYLSQEEQDMNTDQRVIDYVREIAEYIQTRDGKISASQMLERFLFTPDMQYTPVSKLSGGEKRRLHLLCVLIGGANVLILDEPSNNVDIPTLTILEDFLSSFVGIVIAVSHDRYFLDNVVDRIFEFDGTGRLVQYEGGYTDYLETRQSRMEQFDGKSKNPEKTAGKKTELKKKDSVAGWKQSRTEKLKFTFKEQREFETIDEEIAALETKIAGLDEDMLKNATNSLRLSEILREKEKAEAELDEKMDRWVYLNDLAERIEAQKTGKE
ncbi:MAG: ABC-F family ATP-binding cassette domain-containing protein [Fusicatenibacter sp.]|nr:ABC-F family ATP-binding cassette domain-containing protein [Lachnospiraceae bacterium]MDY2938561.1 ABC-F family ATP-binding cassette domain-containing protein [Fusicatenibacter sp.]